MFTTPLVLESMHSGEEMDEMEAGEEMVYNASSDGRIEH